MADNGEGMEKSESAETADVIVEEEEEEDEEEEEKEEEGEEKAEEVEEQELEQEEEMGETEGETEDNLGPEGEIAAEGPVSDEDEEMSDEVLEGEGADDDVPLDPELNGISDISWVEELWNRKEAEEAEGENLEKEEPTSDDNCEAEDESEESRDSSLKEQSSEVDKPSADLNYENETLTGAGQGEATPARCFPETLLPYAKSSSCIPRAYFGPAFDKSYFQTCIKVSPVAYIGVTHEKSQYVLSIADSVQMTVKVDTKLVPSRALVVLCQNPAHLLPHLMSAPLCGINTNFELEKRRVAGWTKVEHNGKMISVPTGFDTSEAPHTVKFLLKQTYYRKALNMKSTIVKFNRKDTKDSSLFITNLPARPDLQQMLKTVFPLALNVDVIKVSENHRSAVLTMKSRQAVLDHLVSVQNLCVDGLKAQMGATNMSQLDAIKQSDQASQQEKMSKAMLKIIGEAHLQTVESGDADVDSSDKTGAGQNRKPSSRKEKQRPERERPERERLERERLEREQSWQQPGDKNTKTRNREPAQRETLGMKEDVRTGLERPQRTERWEGQGHRRPRRQRDIPVEEDEFLMQPSMNTPLEFALQREMERQERERWVWEEMERLNMEQGRSTERWRQGRSELVREKERLEQQLRQEALYKLKMVEELQQQHEHEELHRKQHDLEMEKRRMRQQLGEKPLWRQREKEEWEQQSRKRGRFEPVEGGARHHQRSMPGKRGQGEGEPWDEFFMGDERHEGYRRETSSPEALSEGLMKLQLELEVARQTEELERSLALLDMVKHDPDGIPASLIEVGRSQDVDHRCPASTPFDRLHKQPYGTHFSQASYGSSQGQDYRGQLYSDHGEDMYGQDRSHFQLPHRDGWTSTTADSFDGWYRAQDRARLQISEGWGTGINNADDWKVPESHRHGAYSQLRQTAGYNHGGQQNAGGYQQGGRQGGDSSRPYGQAASRGRGGAGQGGKWRGGQAQQQGRGYGQRK